MCDSPNPPNEQKARYITLAKRHCRKMKRRLRRYRGDSRKAEEALIGEMSVVQTELRSEIPALGGIDPDDRSKFERNVEQMVEALESYISENSEKQGFLSRLVHFIGAIFCTVGVILVLVALLTEVPGVPPVVREILRLEEGFQGKTLTIGGGLATAGGVLIAIKRQK